MAEPVPASGTVHWVGAGLSTGSGLRLVCDLAPRVLLWNRTLRRAEDRLAAHGLSGRASVRAFDLDALAAQLRPGDVVVSMVPATEHAALLAACIPAGAHFACSSYVSDDLLALAAAASQAGVVALTEAGLDPGIDHLLAHQLVAQGRVTVGTTAVSAEFTSYCGGLPAVPNEFRYRFSWAPRGVLGALLSPARYIEESVEKTAVYPWEATHRRELGGEVFEAYPNRDSLPFIGQYGIPPSWRLETFVRGTLRLNGWYEAWEPVFAELRAGDAARITALADELAARYPTTEADHDRVVLAVALRLQAADGPAWSGQYLLDTVGNQDDSAMARCVSLPMAFGVGEILAGRMPPGLHRAAEDADEAAPWLAFLRAHGIELAFTEAEAPSG